MPDMNVPVATQPAPTVLHRQDRLIDPDDLDRALHAWQSHFTGGRSPWTVPLAFADWGAHALNTPFRATTCATSAASQWLRLMRAAVDGSAIVPPPGDHRFDHPSWQMRPYHTLAQALLLGEEWWDTAIRQQPGVSEANTRIVAFTVRQFLDMIAPSNIPWLNPEVIETTRTTGGQNLLAGWENLLRDLGGKAPSGFSVGKNLAVTPGKVILRNELIELIQYSPTTPTVAREPVLIVPAWIMKYYILDLSPHNSLVGWLVSQGHTVFAISWRNPRQDMANTSLDDYRVKGVMAAIDAISAICDGARIHATGYCLGGTLLSITAAAMAGQDDHRLASMTLFAAQTDFTEAGELQLFITEDQLDFLNDVMRTHGYLASEQMGGAFQMLQANDLVWSRMVRSYMLGQRDHPNDLMAWNTDGTRMPARMHAEYLSSLFLHNDLAEGRFKADGQTLALDNIALPMFVVGTERDHIAPWHSVYKLHFLNSGELTFILTSGGHNAGIVSEPGHSNRHFRIRVRPEGGHTLGPDEWEQSTPSRPGSWWEAWGNWLNERCTDQIAPPPMGSSGFRPICDAPGTYVFEE